MACTQYAVTLNELKAVLKVSIQKGQSGAVDKTSVESTAQDDDFQEVKRCKRHISNNTSHAAKKSTKTVPKSTVVQLPPKAVLTHNFFAPFSTDMDMETTGTENIISEQESPRKPGHLASIMITYTTNLIRFQSDLKDHVKYE
jgi:hypothetical protein